MKPEATEPTTDRPNKPPLPPPAEPAPGVIKTTESGLPPMPNELDLCEAARRLTERERLLCPMNWPDD